MNATGDAGLALGNLGEVIDTHELLLPPGTRLLHIGPPKTGTTAVQSALHQARPKLGRLGVSYAGHEQHPYRAALAITGKQDREGHLRAGMEHWDALVADVRSAGDKRVIVSSEFFAEADDEQARTIVAGLGGPVHVVVTLRPLVKILPSAWQQYVRNRLRTSYSRWLKATFDPPRSAELKSSFWRRHRHDELVARWAGIVGPEQVTVVVVDDRDRNHLTRTFEQFVGLPEGLLVPDPSGENRSLTHGETEVVRAINHEFHRRGWSDSAYRAVVRNGLVPALQARKPSRDEPRTLTPEWAVDRAAERSREAAANIRSLGVRVVGDLDQLAARPSTTAPRNPPGVVPAAAVADGVIGVVTAAAAGIPEVAAPGQGIDGRPVDQLRAGEIAQVLGRRARRVARRGVRRVRALRASDQD